MSMKRQASTELNRDNWNEEEEEPEEMGAFKTASKEILEKRVIRTAKRRSHVSGDEQKKSVFSSFGGFKKTQTSSFDFLANLTNSKQNTNGVSSKSETSVSPSLFTSNQSQSSPGINVDSTPAPSSAVFGTSSQSSSIFGSPKTTASSIFTSKIDSTVKENPFKIPAVPSTGDTSNIAITKVTNASTTITTPQETTSIFGTSKATTPNKSVPPTINTSSFILPTTPNKSMPSTTSTSSFILPSLSNNFIDSDDFKRDNMEKKKLQYYSKLKTLNISVSNWIKKHIEEMPLCILSPIFKDYDKYLKEIENDLVRNETNELNNTDKTESEPAKKTEIITSPKTFSTLSSGSNTLTGGSSFMKTENSRQTPFAASANKTPERKAAEISFGIQKSPATSQSTVVTTSGEFSFGIKRTTESTTSSMVTAVTQSNESKSSPFSLKPNTLTTNVSFGIPNSPTSQSVAVTTSGGFSFGIKQTTVSTTSSVVTHSNDTRSSPFSFKPNTSTTNVSFGIPNSPTSQSVAVTTSGGFSFGIKHGTMSTTSSSPTATQSNVTSSPFSFKPNTTTSASSFSFGLGKPYSFGTNVNSNAEKTETKKESTDGQNDEDAPPKVEYTPIAEENSVFEKKCKIFEKKGDNFADKGIGTLYIKKIENSDTHQLLVRANTALGNVLLNLRLSSSIPTQRMGKNNVMIVCMPTPESKPPPTPVLIRVKTSEEADELLETLNKYKK